MNSASFSSTLPSKEHDHTICWIFDLDGTLLNNVTPLTQFFFKDVPIYFKKPTLTKEKEDLMIRKVMEFVSGMKVSKWNVIKQFIWYGKMLELNFRERIDMMKYVKNNIRDVLHQTPFFEGTIEALKILKEERGDKIAINTSSSDAEVSSKFEGREEILNIFNKLIITRDKVKNLKPHPESIQLISKKTGIPIQRCVMVGDMTVDIECGNNAGATSIVVMGGFLDDTWVQNMNPKPDFVFDNVASIIEHIDEIIKFIG